MKKSIYMLRAALSLLSAAVLLSSAQIVLAQTEGTVSIRAESDQVLVPTYVYDQTLVALDNPAGPTKWNWNNGEVRNLAAKDFHLFEDGQEQKIQTVALQRWLADALVHDNVGEHSEHSDTPRGKWRCPDVVTGWIPPAKRYFYLIAYVPPKSAEGSCHQIQVKVDRPNSVVYARSQYCNTKHSFSDPLNGAQFGKQMSREAASGQAGRIGLSLQATFFYRGTAALVDIALEFPWRPLKREWRIDSGQWNEHATIGVMGTISRKDGSLAARFSGLACCSPDLPQFVWGNSSGIDPEEYDPGRIPTGYETQIDLPPGEYSLQIVLSDGEKFGRVQTPLAVDSYDGKQIGVSAIVLCKRFRDVANGPKQADGTVVNLAPEMVPLVSKGIEFTPAGDTLFRKGEDLFAYFEVYEPLLTRTPTRSVDTRLRITSVKTGEIKVDTGLRRATDWIQAGNTVTPVAERVEIEKLPVGSYRLEIQATDSAGKSTPWRAANFTIE